MTFSFGATLYNQHLGFSPETEDSDNRTVNVHVIQSEVQGAENEPETQHHQHKR